MTVFFPSGQSIGVLACLSRAFSASASWTRMQTTPIKNKSRHRYDAATRRNSHLTYRFTTGESGPGLSCVRESFARGGSSVYLASSLRIRIPRTMSTSLIFQIVDSVPPVELARINVARSSPSSSSSSSRYVASKSDEITTGFCDPHFRPDKVVFEGAAATAWCYSVVLH